MKLWRSISIGVLVAGLGGCADVGPPPGGPEDKQGPVLLLATPANGSVNQSAVKSVRMDFSERVTPPVQGVAVYISPRPSTPPKVKWGAKNLTIDFADTLPSNKTYVISVAGSVSDLRGNKPDTGLTLAFSTGPNLDSGSISGIVYDGDKPLSGVNVALYNPGQLNGPYDSVYPDYLALTNGAGRFTLGNLPARNFLLIAYQKSGRDDRFRPLRDRFAVPDREIEIEVGTKNTYSNLGLTLTSQDTTPVKILSAAINSDGLLQMRLSRPLTTGTIDSSLANLVLETAGQRQHAVALAPSDSVQTSTVTAYMGSISPGMAAIEWQIDPSSPLVRFDSLKIPPPKDTVRPAIVAIYPSDKPVLTTDTAVHVIFSEPLDTNKLQASSFVLNSAKDSAVVHASRSTRSPFEVILHPDHLQVGTAYNLVIDGESIEDLAGNTLGDSIRPVTFSIVHPDSLGWIAGTVHTGLASDTSAPVTLFFRKVNDNQQFSTNTAHGAFKIALPGGKYTIDGFVDRNRNNQYDRGKIFPLTFAETRVHYTDTVSVRARFETAGVDIAVK